MIDSHRSTTVMPAGRSGVHGPDTDRRDAASVFAVTALLVLLSMLAPDRALAEQVVGGEEFMAQCAACHGTSARGDGPVTEYLGINPGDLTKLTTKSNGEFPFVKIFHIVDGRQEVGAHGTRTMPVWGKRYLMEAGDSYGSFGAEQVIRGRILDIVYYLQQIQEP